MIKFEENNCYSYIFISTLSKIVCTNAYMDISFEDLLIIDRQKKELLQNTLFFQNRDKFNNVLLWGEKGTGKSTLIKSITNYVNKKSGRKISLLEVLSSDIKYLPELIWKISKKKELFIIFIDDLSVNYLSKEFNIVKTIFEGSGLSYYNNVVFYVTSNIRSITSKKQHKLNEIESKDQNNSIYSLSQRFGLSLGFHKFNKQNYLDIIEHYIKKYKVNVKSRDSLVKNSLAWSIQKGGFSGRVAKQFIIQYLQDISR